MLSTKGSFDEYVRESWIIGNFGFIGWRTDLVSALSNMEGPCQFLPLTIPAQFAFPGSLECKNCSPRE